MHVRYDKLIAFPKRSYEESWSLIASSYFSFFSSLEGSQKMLQLNKS
jgi:hypothetical protein